jgi:NAD(P)-dependent dehydrogenase (short-subunit alcohol dehydrogenase family)
VGESGVAGRTVLVTGGGAGIGRAMVDAFHAEGARVLAVDVQLDRAEETVARLGGGDRLAAHQVDVADPASVARLAAAVAASGDVVDVLCNNAGIFDDYRQAHDASPEEWARVLAVNATGPFLLSASFAPGMLERGSGAIINTASIASVVAGAGGVAYTTSKHAVLGLTRQLAFDYGSRGVRVNAICPGVVATHMSAAAQDGGNPHIDRMIPMTPAGRWARPEEIARVAVFLASDDASFMHGNAVMADGGWTLS